jgi:molybdopterin-guanine dinucleotide biosynthesis protein MobB
MGRRKSVPSATVLPPAVSFVGDSGVGKTTLLTAIVSILASDGLRVGVIKHSTHFDDLDVPGKDSARLRQSGARQVLLASPGRSVFFHDHPGGEPAFESRLELFHGVDLVLVESYRTAGLPAVEVLRSALPRRTPRLLGDPGWRALVADFDPEGVPAGVLRFSLEDPASVARWLLTIRRAPGASPTS